MTNITNPLKSVFLISFNHYIKGRAQTAWQNVESNVQVMCTLKWDFFRKVVSWKWNLICEKSYNANYAAMLSVYFIRKSNVRVRNTLVCTTGQCPQISPLLFIVWIQLLNMRHEIFCSGSILHKIKFPLTLSLHEYSVLWSHRFKIF